MTQNLIEPPNYTQIPNIIFDHWMAILSPGAFKILVCMCRKIFGWHKTSDTISKNQLMKVTGMSKNSVQSGIEELERHGLLLKFQHKTEYGHQPNTFRLKLDKPKDELYQDPKDFSDDQNLGGGRSEIDLGVGQNLTQGVGQNLTPQKKDYTKERLTKDYIVRNPTSRCSEPKNKDFVFSQDSQKFEGIKDSDWESWKVAYPLIDLKQEVVRAEQWLIANETKAKLKRKWRKFLTTWFKTADEKAERTKVYQSINQKNNAPQSEEENRVFAQEMAKKHNKQTAPSQIEVLSKHVEFFKKGVQPGTVILSYGEKGFVQQFDSLLRKFGLK